MTPQRAFGYDTLVIAVGSLTQRLRHARRRASTRSRSRRRPRPSASTAGWSTPASAPTRRPTPLRPEQLHVAIIGAGATGVELAAELHRTTREVVAYGLDRIDPEKDIQVNLIEAARPHPARAAAAPVARRPMRLLDKLGVQRAHVGARWPRCCRTACGSPTAEMMPAELVVWAAGVKAPDFLKDIAGLETNRINQLVVRPTLQTTRDDDIFAIGDCAACPWLGKEAGGWCRRARRPRTSRPRTWWGRSTAGCAGRPLQALPLPRLRLAGLARRVQHRRQHDGRPDRRQPDDRRLLRADDVRVALQDARARAARLLQGRARHARAPDHAAHRAAREAALSRRKIGIDANKCMKKRRHTQRRCHIPKMPPLVAPQCATASAASPC